MQGESLLIIRLLQNYEANVKNLIEKSRQVFGYNMPWSIARSTVSSRNEWADLVIKGQNAILKNVPNTFAVTRNRYYSKSQTYCSRAFRKCQKWYSGINTSCYSMDAHDGYNFFKKAIPYQPQATLVPRLLPTHLPFGRNFAVYFQEVPVRIRPIE
jgi:hypothetical protein